VLPQISVIDGETRNLSGMAPHASELLTSDDGHVLLGAHISGTKNDGFGRLLLRLQVRSGAKGEGAFSLPLRAVLFT
jgi:hypothetical protein